MKRWTFAAVIALLFGGCTDATAPTSAADLQVWAEVIPSTLSIGDTTGSLKIRVHVFNANFYTVRVPGGPPYVFASDPTQSKGIEEAFVIGNDESPSNAGPGTSYWGQNEYVFPRFSSEYTETVVTLKLWASGGWALVPGKYRVRSFFNGHEGASANFSLVR